MFLIVFPLTSCTFFNHDVPTNYPNSVWESSPDDPIYVVLRVGEDMDMSSDVTYNNLTLKFTNYIISEVMYFDLIDEELKSFTVSHSFVKNGETIECTLWHNFEKVFELDEPIELSFTLTKISN